MSNRGLRFKYHLTDYQREVLTRISNGLGRGDRSESKTIRRLRMKGLLVSGTFELTAAGRIALATGSKP